MVYGTPEFAQLLKDIIESKKRHPLYEETCRHAEAMSVHIMGDKPMYLLQRARPREEEDVQLYRVENYEPTTKSSADKAIDIVSKIFNPTLHSIVWKEKTPESEELEQYTAYYYPVYNSVVNFDKDVLLRKMLADPNGLVAVKPGEIPEDDTKRLEPEITIYGSPCIYYYDRDHYLIFKHEEQRENKKFYYFEYYDKTSYLNFNAWYDSSNKVVETTIEEEYLHGFNEIPAWFLRGKSKCHDNGAIVYESFFSPALAHWNLAVIHESDLIGAFINHMHPQKYEETEECAYKFDWEGQMYPCRGGTIKYPGSKGKGTEMDCPRCGGTGRHSVKSPYGTYQFLKSRLDELPNGRMPVGYITIPVEATKLLKEHTREMNEAAMASINMEIEDKVGENQSGIAKTIDRSAQYDTIFNIGSVVFDVHLTNEYYFINKYMFKEEAQSTRKEENKNLPEINKPTKFDILTTAELVNNFKVANESKLDKNYLRIKQIEIINRDLGTMPDIKNYMITMLELDPLFGFTQDEIDLGVTKGVIRKVDWSIHDNLKAFLDRAIEENQDFLTKAKKDKILILEGYANELITAEKPRVDESLLIKQEQEEEMQA